jgi:maltooligosyltrehalose trehalohydrolase
MLGERLTTLVSFEALKLAGAAVILSPNIPLLFMGEEFAEEAPFLYFVSHSDPSLIAAVRKGRGEEFADFVWTREPPDPQDLATFERSKLNWGTRSNGKHQVMLDYYKFLLKIRREEPALSHLDKDALEVTSIDQQRVMTIHRWNNSSRVYMIFNFNSTAQSVRPGFADGQWKTVLDSADTIWNGPGTQIPSNVNSQDKLELEPHSIAVFRKETHS